MVKATIITTIILGCLACDQQKGNESSMREATIPSPSHMEVSDTRLTRSDAKCCLQGYLDSIQVDTNFHLMPAAHQVLNKELIIQDNKRSTKWNAPKIKTWLSEADSANLKAYHIEGFKGRYKVVTAPIATATGLAVNFTKWLVLRGNNEVVTEFWSLLDDPQSVFHRRDARYFEILALDFSKEFLDKRDFEHPSYELITHILGKGVSRTNLIGESTCPCPD